MVEISKCQELKCQKLIEAYGTVQPSTYLKKKKM